MQRRRASFFDVPSKLDTTLRYYVLNVNTHLQHYNILNCATCLQVYIHFSYVEMKKYRCSRRIIYNSIFVFFYLYRDLKLRIFKKQRETDQVYMHRNFFIAGNYFTDFRNVRVDHCIAVNMCFVAKIILVIKLQSLWIFRNLLFYGTKVLLAIL